MDDIHRQIELQSPEDLVFLITNARRVAAEHLDEAFPLVDDQGDEMRAQIEELVNEYVNRTYARAAPNLTINGLPIPSVDPYLFPDGPAGSSRQADKEEAEVEVEYEPFDARKRQRAVALAAEAEDLLRDIANLKRRVPAQAAARLAEAERVAMRDDEEALQRKIAEINARAQAAAAAAASCSFSSLAKRGGGRKSVAPGGAAAAAAPLVADALDPTFDGREAEVEREFGEALAGLERLKREMPAVVAKMERAKAAGEYVAAGTGG